MSLYYRILLRYLLHICRKRVFLNQGCLKETYFYFSSESDAIKFTMKLFRKRFILFLWQVASYEETFSKPVETCWLSSKKSFRKTCRLTRFNLSLRSFRFVSMTARALSENCFSQLTHHRKSRNHNDFFQYLKIEQKSQ